MKLLISLSLIHYLINQLIIIATVLFYFHLAEKKPDFIAIGTIRSLKGLNGKVV